MDIDIPSRMIEPKGKLSHDRRTFAIGIAITVFAGVLGLSRLGEGLANLSYDLLFLFRGHQPRSEVVVLYMDDDSHRKLHQPHRAPWNRNIHADAINQLASNHTKAVILDVLFHDADESTNSKDHLLLAAAANHGRAVFGAEVKLETAGGVTTPRLEKPFSDVLPWGVAETAADEDIVRQHYRDLWQALPSLAWTAVEATEGPPGLDRSQPRWINYYGPPGFLPHFSYYELISNSIPIAALSNKVVVIGEKYGLGYTGGSRTDDFRTPYSRWTGGRSPGPEVTATTYLNLLHREWLTELPLRYGMIVILGCGILFSAGLLFLRPTSAAAYGGGAIIVVSALAIWLTWRTLVWFPWIVPVGVQIPVAFFWCLLAHNKLLQRERQMLQIQLAAVQFHPVESDARPSREKPSAASRDALAWQDQPTVQLNQRNGPPPIPDHMLLRCIGRGAYGEVWLARNAIGTYHAVKIVHRSNFSDGAPFEREFRGIQKFTPISRSHPGFLNILHVGRDDRHGHFYYIMELGDDKQTGQNVDPATYTPRTLAQELQRRGRLPVSESLIVALNLSSALQHLHQHHLIHRDIKPANIVFVENAPKLADIGLVTNMSADGREATLVGTPDYIAPEGPGTAAADIYSLGKVIYQIYTGMPCNQFPALPAVLFNDGDSDPLLGSLNQIVLRACDRDLCKRFQSAAEMHDCLRALQNRR
jgi:CHASE2 domain-containing sensor protein